MFCSWMIFSSAVSCNSTKPSWIGKERLWGRPKGVETLDVHAHTHTYIQLISELIRFNPELFSPSVEDWQQGIELLIDRSIHVE